jgi:drug/metabolite transporter (DMT)-like permease
MKKQHDHLDRCGSFRENHYSRLIMGIFFSIWAAFFFSISHITLRKGVIKLGVSSGTIIMLLSGTVTSLTLALVLEGVQVLSSADLISIMYFALGGVIHFLGGWGFQNLSASRIGPTRLSAMTGATPLFAALLAFFTLNQVVNLYILGGIFLIAIGIFTITIVGNNG